MEPQASETMDMELAAYQSVEEAAREFQGRCQEMKDQLEAEAVRLEEISELLEEGGDGEHEENGEEDETGPDWDQIQELMDMVQIPEAAVQEPVDQEKSSALDRLEEMLSGDLLKLVIPKGVKLSEKRVRAGQNGPSKEQSEEKTESNGLAAQLLVNEYILLYFDSFLKKSESREELADQALDYEQEYLLCGKGSDRDNLAQTVEQLLMIEYITTHHITNSHFSTAIQCRTFHSVTFLIDRLRKCNLTPDCRRICNFGHQNRITALVQFINCARGDIPAAADDNDIFFHFPYPLWFYNVICFHHCLRDHVHIGHRTNRQFFGQSVMVQTCSTGHDLHALRLHAL